jgi:ABC-type multidrug transport system fused ATPase/permease subunit
VRHADVIVVLDDGRIVEQGNHVELLAHNGVYAELHRHQQLEEELEAS